MRKTGILLILLIGFSIFGIAQIGIINKGSKLSFLNDSSINNLAFFQYEDYLTKQIILHPEKNADVLKGKLVGEKVFTAIKTYFNGQKALYNEWNKLYWAINFVEKKEAMAWCVPGGKVVVNSGVLALTQGDGSFAALVSHLVAHTLLKHGNQRMNQLLDEKMKGKSLTEALTLARDATTDKFVAAFGMGTNAGVWVPFSVEQEKEADHLGLILCGLAGYQPKEFLVFWSRMGHLKHSPLEPLFLNVHLVDEKRLEYISEIMDEILLKYYKPIIKK